jgi:hypothetical protein
VSENPRPAHGGGKCDCGSNANVRYGNGNNWSPTKVKDGLFTCASTEFDPVQPSPVSDKQGHCECDRSDALQELNNAGTGFSQCSSYSVKTATGTLAVYNLAGGSMKDMVRTTIHSQYVHNTFTIRSQLDNNTFTMDNGKKGEVKNKNTSHT